MAKLRMEDVLKDQDSLVAFTDRLRKEVGGELGNVAADALLAQECAYANTEDALDLANEHIKELMAKIALYEEAA